MLPPPSGKQIHNSQTQKRKLNLYAQFRRTHRVTILKKPFKNICKLQLFQNFHLRNTFPIVSITRHMLRMCKLRKRQIKKANRWRRGGCTSRERRLNKKAPSRISCQSRFATSNMLLSSHSFLLLNASRFCEISIRKWKTN